MTGVTRLPALTRGHHQDLSEGACLMELASLAVGEPWSDHPACVHPVLAAVARGVNDGVTDACRPRLGALIRQMIGTAAQGTVDDQRAYLDRSARITMRCATVALGQTAVLASEMESARRTALAVLARRHRRADSASKADRTDRADRKDRSPTADRAEGPAMNVNLVQSGVTETHIHRADAAEPRPPPARYARIVGVRGPARSGLAARLGVALLDRAGLLDRMYPAAAARQVAQAIALLRAPQCDRVLARLLEDCIADCASLSSRSADIAAAQAGHPRGGQRHRHGGEPGQRHGTERAARQLGHVGER